jgi:hypothetical protein
MDEGRLFGEKGKAPIVCRWCPPNRTKRRSFGENVQLIPLKLIKLPLPFLREES